MSTALHSLLLVEREFVTRCLSLALYFRNRERQCKYVGSFDHLAVSSPFPGGPKSASKEGAQAGTKGRSRQPGPFDSHKSLVTLFRSHKNAKDLDNGATFA